MATVLSKDDTVVVSIDGKYSQQMDHLMQFLYLGVLTIDPRWLHDLCKLGDKLHIKFLVDGVDGPLLHPLVRFNFNQILVLIFSSSIF